MVAGINRLKRVEERRPCSRIERGHDCPLHHPIGRQRVSLEPQQAHAPGLLPGQDRQDDGGLQQGQAQQFVDRRVVQAFALSDLAAAGHHAVVEQSLPVEAALT